jgi:hypothetical protein
MSDHIRAKLEALITDSGMYNAGKQEERLRLCHLIDFRLDQLRNLTGHPHATARREELLNLRKALKNVDNRSA